MNTTTKILLTLSFSLLPFSAFCDNYDDLKTAYIYKMIEYINWPDDNFSTLDICIFGSEINPTNKDFLESKRAFNKRIKVKHVLKEENILGCQILVIQKGYSDFISNETYDSNYAMLSFGEDHEFLKRGGHILFKQKNHKLKFDINLIGIRKSDINVSSSLLEIADIVIK